MSKTIRLIRDNDPSTYEQQIRLFGTLPDQSSRDKVLATLESFDPHYHDRVRNTGEIPVYNPSKGNDPILIKGATHPAYKGFDLGTHAVAQLTCDEHPAKFTTHEDVKDENGTVTVITKEMPYPFFFGEDDKFALQNDPMFKGFMYGINVLKRTRNIQVPDKSKVDTEYGFTTPEVIACGAGTFLVAQCMEVDTVNGVFKDYENYYPTHYGEYAPTNITRLATFAVMTSDEAKLYVPSSALQVA